MAWTQEKIVRIPAEYRDLLFALKPIIDSRTSVLRITGIPIGHLYNAVAYKYNYTESQVRQLARNLAKEGLVRGPDEMGFYAPTAQGEDLIAAMAGEPVPEVAEVPPFPKLAK